jgi:ABC-2 type transport system ATP-binding protein
LAACRLLSVKLLEPGCGLMLTDVTKVYEKQKVLDNLSLTVKAGEVFGLLGPNGAGKTTAMKVIAGLVRPNSGSVRIFGLDTASKSVTVKQLVGLVPQDNNLERELTVEEALRVYGRLFAIPDLKQQVEEKLTEFSLGAVRDKRVGLLSGGMARRVLIARALLPQPELLLLDEPTVGLDPDVRHEIWDIIQRLAAEGKTVVLTTHYMEEAEKLCHRVAMLRTGRLVLLDTPDGIRNRLGTKDGAAAALETVFIQLAKGGGV